MTNFDAVPWFTEGGRHSANVARNVAYAAFKGKQGIMAPKDFEVRETATPGASVDVYPGTRSAINRAGGVSGEMYVGRLPILDNVPIAATTATARHDLICARVVNPFFEGGFPASGWPTLNADPKLGPFIALFVVSNVGATVKTLFEHDPTMTGVALARVDLPASTSVVTQSMIVDLRKMCGVRNERFFKIVVGASGSFLERKSAHARRPLRTPKRFSKARARSALFTSAPPPLPKMPPMSDASAITSVNVKCSGVLPSAAYSAGSLVGFISASSMYWLIPATNASAPDLTFAPSAP